MVEEALLELDGLRVSFVSRRGEVQAVRGVDLRVHPEETVAVVGESGSGKSVSMMAALGLLPENAVVAGAVRFAGQDLRSLSDTARRRLRGREIGVVFQDPMSSLNPVHRVRDQIAESLIVHAGQTRRAAQAKAVELLEEVGIPDAPRRAGCYPHEFSGGMRQRVMIAMALACQPSLLIADEPTTALDVTVQAQITDLVQRLQRDHGMAVVWITHDLGVVAQLADRVSVMYAGRVVEEGSCEDIYAAPRHPYTVGLLTAVPRLNAPLGGDLVEIPGSPPDPQRVPPGCPFAPRCSLAQDRCHAEAPPLVQVGAGHSSSCWFAPKAPTEAIRVAEPEDRSRQEPAPGHRAANRTGKATRDLLEVGGLQVYFRGRVGWLRSGPPIRAVDGVSLTINQGETLGLVGESGSGKSTLARAIVGIERPTGGMIRLDGIDCASATTAQLRQLRRTAQMVFQDPASSMNPALTIAEVIEEPLRINRVGSRQERRRRAAELLDLVELPRQALNRYPHEFSGGQRQRVAIARALALDPLLLVCDEAVSALDVSVQAQIINLFGKLKRELGLSLLFIAHDLAVVRHIADRVAVMYLGQIVETGTREQIYQDPQHPYTRALLAAVPVADPRARSNRSLALRGDIPSPSDPPSGCRFRTRCQFAVPGLCDVREPELVVRTGHHPAACHLAGQLQAAAPDHQQSHRNPERGTPDESITVAR